MIAYKYLMNKIYPARINDKPNLLYYNELAKAHFQLTHSTGEDELLLTKYRNAFVFFRKQVCNAANDGYRVLQHELDDFEKTQLEHCIKKLKSTFYDMDELLEIISYINLILSGHDVGSKRITANLLNSIEDTENKV